MLGRMLAWARVAQSRKISDPVWTTPRFTASVTEKDRLPVAARTCA